MFDIENFMIFLASIAGLLVLLGFLPQVIKSYKTKQMDDVSSFLMILIAVGMFLWIIYGIYRKDPTIIGTNVGGMTLNLIQVWQKKIFINIIRPNEFHAC